MSIKTFVILLALVEQELPTLPEYSRANRRAAREKTIAHNRKTYRNLVGGGIWFDIPDENGNFVGYHHSKVTNKSQQGRWETHKLSGHRRFQKWSRDYYASGKDEFARRCWQEELEEYFNS